MWFRPLIFLERYGSTTRYPDGSTKCQLVEVKSALRIGAIVHYVLPDWDESISYHSKALTALPLLCAYGGLKRCNCKFFTDGSNDLKTGDNVIWRTSVHQDESAALVACGTGPEEPQYSCWRSAMQVDLTLQGLDSGCECRADLIAITIPQTRARYGRQNENISAPPRGKTSLVLAAAFIGIVRGLVAGRGL